MKKGDIIYFVDKTAKYYFDMKLLEIKYLDDYNTNVYKCKILYNNYKFNNTEIYKPNLKLKGTINIFPESLLVDTKQEAERIIS